MTVAESNFTDSDHAYWYVHEALTADGLLGNDAELLVCGRVHGHHTGQVRTLLRFLRRHLAHFPLIHIHYEPDDEYAVVLVITCPAHRKLGSRPAKLRNPPRIVLPLREREGKAVLLGSARIVPRPMTNPVLPPDTEVPEPKPAAALSRPV